MLGREGGRSFSAAAWTLRSAREDIGELYTSGRLGKLRGVGPRVVEVVGAILAGETPPLLTELEAQIPEGLYEIGRIPGLGPKKVRALWQDLGVTTLGELEYACNENRLVDLKGFGLKTQDKVIEGIAQVRAHAGWFRLDHALAVARVLSEATAGKLVGPARRGCEIVDGVDLLVEGPAPTEPTALDGVPVRWHAWEDPKTLGVGLALRTGSAGHVERLRARATERGLQLTDSALLRGGAPVPTPDEGSLYGALGVHLPSPERREDDVALVPSSEPGPRLLRRGDLLGALHNHTTASDGLDTLTEMRAAAAGLGLTYLGISDHSQSAFYAKGLSPETLAAQVETIAELNGEGHPCALLSGVESDILADGALDYEPDTLGLLDVVVASVHSRHGQRGEPMTQRTSLVGHPTGRLLLGRPPTEFDMERFLDACVEGGCAVELNASPHRLDLHERHLAMARERGLRVSIAADAHSRQALAHLDFGVTIARRAGLRPEDILNCLSLEELRAWLSERRARASRST